MRLNVSPSLAQMERILEMKKSLASLVLAAMGVLLLTGTNAWADPIQWSFTAAPITDINGVPFSGGQLPSSTSPLSSIKFSPSSGNVTGSTGIIIYNMTTLSQQASATPDSFNNVDFLASFNVTDTKTNFPGNPTASAVITFHGQYNASNVSAGSLTKGAITWINDQGNVSATEATVVLGSGSDVRTYDFQINPGDFLSSQAPGGGVGSFAVDATVTDGGTTGGSGETGPPPSQTPEPASLVLAGLGVPLVVFLRRRFKKANAELAIA
jgi:PEP-CTERM motif